MKTRDIVILAIVLAGIAWLIIENYHRSQTQPAAPKTPTIEHTQPLTK